MANYKIIEVVKTADNESQSLYDNEERTSAIAKMRNDFGNALKEDATIAAYAIVIDNNDGSKIDSCYWKQEDVIDPETQEPVVDAVIKNRVYTHNDYTDDNLSPYDSEKLAIGNYNTKIASAMNKATCNFAITIRIKPDGSYGDYDLFARESN